VTDRAFARLARERGVGRATAGTRASLMAPLMFDPGEGWEYGIGIDLCGQVIEVVRILENFALYRHSEISMQGRVA
jgi:methyl acetate hydrolase